jgi:hypothetical protein
MHTRARTHTLPTASHPDAGPSHLSLDGEEDKDAEGGRPRPPPSLPPWLDRLLLLVRLLAYLHDVYDARARVHAGAEPLLPPAPLPLDLGRYVHGAVSACGGGVGTAGRRAGYVLSLVGEGVGCAQSGPHDVGDGIAPGMGMCWWDPAACVCVCNNGVPPLVLRSSPSPFLLSTSHSPTTVPTSPHAHVHPHTHTHTRTCTRASCCSFAWEERETLLRPVPPAAAGGSPADRALPRSRAQAPSSSGSSSGGSGGGGGGGGERGLGAIPALCALQVKWGEAEDRQLLQWMAAETAAAAAAARARAHPTAGAGVGVGSAGSSAPNSPVLSPLRRGGQLHSSNSSSNSSSSSSGAAPPPPVLTLPLEVFLAASPGCKAFHGLQGFTTGELRARYCLLASLNALAREATGLLRLPVRPVPEPGASPSPARTPGHDALGRAADEATGVVASPTAVAVAVTAAAATGAPAPAAAVAADAGKGRSTDAADASGWAQEECGALGALLHRHRWLLVPEAKHEWLERVMTCTAVAAPATRPKVTVNRWVAGGWGAGGRVDMGRQAGGGGIAGASAGAPCGAYSL